MKTRLLLTASLLLASPSAALFADVVASPKQTAPEHSEEKETELGGKMGEIGKAFRKLKKQLSDPTKVADTLELIAKIKKSAEAATTLTPELAAEVPAAERPKFLADYQAKMKDFLVSIDALAAAVKAGKFEDATKLAADLSTQMKAGHKQFKKPDPKH